MIRFATLALVILVGCKSKAECQAQVDDLMKFLRAMDHSMSPFPPDSVHLVMRPDLPKQEPRVLPIVVVTPREVLYQGSPLSKDELGDRLHEVFARLKEDADRHRPGRELQDPRQLLVAIDGAATWERVTGVAEVMAASGFTRAVFLFERPSPVAPPPRTWVDDKLDGTLHDDPSNRAVGVAKIASDLVKSCKPVAAVFGSVASVSPEDKAGFIIEGIGPGLVDCNCDADLPALRTIMWRIAGNPHPSATIEVELQKGGKRIELAAATPWSEAYKQLAPAAVVWPVAK